MDGAPAAYMDVLAAAAKSLFCDRGLRLIQLLRRKPVLAQQLEQSAITHEVQRAHDHQAVALAVQELLDLRQPALIALPHQRAIQRREGAVLARQQGGEPGSVAAAPGAEHLPQLAGGLLQLTQRLVEQPQLILARQRLQTAELFGHSLQARGRLAVGLCALHELRLDALLRIEPQTQVLRSEEHTSELQSQSNLVCRLLLEKKKQ